MGGSTVAAYTAQRLWEPLGAEADGFYIMDGAPGVGREFSGAGFNATLRDFARCRADDAQWRRGERPADRLAGMDRRVHAPTREQRGAGYGYQWWMAGAPVPSGVGLQGQYIYVDPASRTVIVKLSYFPPGDATADEVARVLRCCLGLEAALRGSTGRRFNLEDQGDLFMAAIRNVCLGLR